MEQFILNVLNGYGLAGLVILGLGWVVLHQHRSAERVNETRLKERSTDVEVLIRALDNNTGATSENAQAVMTRNEVIEDLSRAIDKQALVFELFMQKMEMHDDGFKDKFQDFQRVVDSFADAMRQNTAVCREIRDRVDQIAPRRR